MSSKRPVLQAHSIAVDQVGGGGGGGALASTGSGWADERAGGGGIDSEQTVNECKVMKSEC